MTSPHASTPRRIAMLPVACAAVWHGLAIATPASARTLLVGPGAPFARPSDAAAAARPGDRVQIAAGTYYDCSVWTVPDLVIAGAGAATTRLTDRVCQGKAILVIQGRNTVVADLTLARARAPDGNGAGIRAEAPNLTLLRLDVEDDQDGLLAGDQPGGVLRVEDCDFSADGVAGAGHPTAALVVGRWQRMTVERSRFASGPGQSAIISAADVTQVEASRLDRAGPGGATIAITGGLVLDASTIEAGDGPGAHSAAVLALPGANALVLHRTVLHGGGTLLLNWSGHAADLADNQVGSGTEVATGGGLWFRLRMALHDAYAGLHHAAGALHRRLLGLLR